MLRKGGREGREGEGEGGCTRREGGGGGVKGALSSCLSLLFREIAQHDEAMVQKVAACRRL